MGMREIAREGENLREYRKNLEKQKITCEQLRNTAREELIEAYYELREASKLDEDGNPIGDVLSAKAHVYFCESKLEDLETRLKETQDDLSNNTTEVERVITEIDSYNKREQKNINVLQEFSKKAFSGKAKGFAAEIIARMNQGADEKDRLLQSIGKEADGRRYSDPGLPAAAYDYGNSIVNVQNKDDTENNAKWTFEYLPLIEKNIRVHVEELFPGYIDKDKMDNAINCIRFYSYQDVKKMANANQIVLGFNNGSKSIVADNFRAQTKEINVEGHSFNGSGETPINVAFVTAVHENFHMLSANDDAYTYRRGIVIGNDTKSVAMNEAITESFTFLACGGDRSGGGLYPGKYSGYTSIMEKLPILEKAVGRDVIAEAYFHNNPDVLLRAVDSIIGDGSWQKLCDASDDFFYHKRANNAEKRLNDIFDALKSYNEHNEQVKAEKKESKEEYLRMKENLISEKIRRMQDASENADDEDDVPTTLKRVLHR